MFERSLSGHTWQDYLHAVMELKHAPENAAKGVGALRALAGSRVPITAIQSRSQNIPVPTAEAFLFPLTAKTQMLMSMVGLLKKN